MNPIQNTNWLPYSSPSNQCSCVNDDPRDYYCRDDYLDPPLRPFPSAKIAHFPQAHQPQLIHIQLSLSAETVNAMTFFLPMVILFFQVFNCLKSCYHNSSWRQPTTDATRSLRRRAHAKNNLNQDNLTTAVALPLPPPQLTSQATLPADRAIIREETTEEGIRRLARTVGWRRKDQQLIFRHIEAYFNAKTKPPLATSFAYRTWLVWQDMRRYYASDLDDNLEVADNNSFPLTYLPPEVMSIVWLAVEKSHLYLTVSRQELVTIRENMRQGIMNEIYRYRKKNEPCCPLSFATGLLNAIRGYFDSIQAEDIENKIPSYLEIIFCAAYKFKKSRRIPWLGLFVPPNKYQILNFYLEALAMIPAPAVFATQKNQTLSYNDYRQHIHDNLKKWFIIEKYPIDLLPAEPELG